MTLLTLATSLCLALGTHAMPQVRGDKCAPTAEWTGWKDIKHAFIFGDSYTTTGFNYTKAAPSPANPVGNPAYPGSTSSNGENWVGYLTTKYNASLLQTYNLAYGGAVVDQDFIKQYRPDVLSVKQQVREEFIPGYTGNSPSAPSVPKWTGADSLFAVWIGINDVGNSYGPQPTTLDELYTQVFDVYSGLLGELQVSGARNFLFINVPPVDRSPLTKREPEHSQQVEKKAIANWNKRVADVASALKANHTDAVNVWLYDSNKSFTQALDDPSTFEATAGLKNTTIFCDAYQNGTPKPNTFTPSCGVPVNEYFWLNDLHPTYPIHDVVAKQVTEALKAGPDIC
ncbi:carbohydrate esterase family 16 protein [Hypoxylon sp. FL1284]|nr:carbohydrate esterase family 16 protein [Hypoxylon sp. FL1284]